MKIKEPKKCSAVEPSNFSAVLEASDSALNQLVDSSSPKPAKFPQVPEECTPNISVIHQSGMTCIPSELTEENSTALLAEARVKTSVDVAESGELKESDRDCGGKCSESSTSADPLSLVGKTLRERCLADVEKWLPASEWSDIKSRAQSSYRHRNSERRTKENASSLLDTPTTYPESLKGQGEAGRNKLETSLRLPVNIPTPRANDAAQGYNMGERGGMNLTGYLRLATPASRDCKGISPTQNQGASATLPDNLHPFILPTESANPQVWGWMMGFPRNWCESVPMPPSSWELSERDGGAENSHPSKPACQESESKAGATASTTTEPPVCPVKLSHSPSELNICGNSFKTSGLAISFGKTLPYLPHKTVTRRCWKDSHAKKFTNALHQHKLIKALDKDIRYGGKQIGWCRLLCAPYKEKLSSMPDADLLAEGGMCESVEAFIDQYFKGDASLEVWVIRFEFIGTENRGAYSASDSASNNNSNVSLTTQSIHQALLCPLGVYQSNGNQVNSNSATSSLIKSIHQSSTLNLGVYSNDNNQIDSNYPIASTTQSIHQAPIIQGGSGLVYAFWKGESMVNHYRYKVKVNGKWKVRSIYIPVGKLPKVREAIISNLGVTAIVTKILGKELK